MGLPLTIFRLADRIRISRSSPRHDVPAFHPTSRPARPFGSLIWLHVSSSTDRQIIKDIIAQISDIFPDVWFLITGTGDPKSVATENAISQDLPDENQTATAGFMRHWRPDLCLWIAAPMRPAVIAAAHDISTMLILLNAGPAIKQWPRWMTAIGLRREILRTFHSIVAEDDDITISARSAGARDAQLQVQGMLEPATAALPCNQTDRDALGQALTTRPVWLAAEICETEFEVVIQAHLQAVRRAHRLMLILSPMDPAHGDRLAQLLDHHGLLFMRRSLRQEPDADTQVYLVDTDGEMGLWYRLAPISFIGGTMHENSTHGPNPFDAAALGSAILHGPFTDKNATAFDRLERAGAARQVTDANQLGQAVETLLAPDKAALMAQAAWQIETSGADVTDHIITLVTARLDDEGTSA
jgi:3-deoxy-D-manno-octulosonic-acid transferase